MTENERAVQVYILRYRVHIQRTHSLAVKVADIRVNYLGDQGSDQIFDFSDFDSFDVLGRSGVYIRTFRLK